MDIQLFKVDPSQRYDVDITVYRRGEILTSSGLVNAPASRLETIANKVAKYMLTTKGSDALDAEYGSYLPTYQTMTEGLLPRTQVEISGDIIACTQAIQNSELDLLDTIEKLDSIALLEIQFYKKQLRLEVYIQVSTTFGNSALLNVTAG
jgi:hypothetical protein